MGGRPDLYWALLFDVKEWGQPIALCGDTIGFSVALLLQELLLS